MNLLQEHLTLLIFSFVCILSLNSKFYISLSICFLYFALLYKFTQKNKSRKYEYMTTSVLTLIFFYFFSDVIFFNNFDFFQLKFYFLSLCYFHFMEYIFSLVYHPDKLSFDSFLINHSKEYICAIILSFVEYFLEYYFFREIKVNYVVILIGIVVVLIGHIFRTGAEFTAKSNFTHLVAHKKKGSHILVTRGLYSISRHPSYFGFFAWSVGNQILLINPICIIAYILVNWKFFNDRIKDEEIYLITFFGIDYIQYKRRVPILIPFIDHNEEEELEALKYHQELYKTYE